MVPGCAESVTCRPCGSGLVRSSIILAGSCNQMWKLQQSVTSERGFLAERLLVANRKHAAPPAWGGGGRGGLIFLPSSCGNRDNPPRSQRRLCRGASVSFPSRRFHDFFIIPHEISDILPISLPQGAERAPVTLGRGGGRGGKSLCIKPRSPNNGSLAWMAPRHSHLPRRERSPFCQLLWNAEAD